jgi:hypothetical protein
MSNIEMWIEKDMGGSNDVINQNLTYDQNGADTYNTLSFEIQSG